MKWTFSMAATAAVGTLFAGVAGGFADLSIYGWQVGPDSAALLACGFLLITVSLGSHSRSENPLCDGHHCMEKAKIEVADDIRFCPRCAADFFDSMQNVEGLE